MQTCDEIFGPLQTLNSTLQVILGVKNGIRGPTPLSGKIGHNKIKSRLKKVEKKKKVPLLAKSHPFWYFES